MELCSGCRGRARKRGGRGLTVTPPTGRLRDSNPISFMASTQVYRLFVYHVCLQGFQSYVHFFEQLKLVGAVI